jgi:predicted RND superfamily exporter protein
MVTYRSTVAGMFFMVPVLLSNTLTFSYMAWKGIGMNINTLPVVALGIGLGVDYSFYIVDGIREELHHPQGCGPRHRQVHRHFRQGGADHRADPGDQRGLVELLVPAPAGRHGVLIAIWLFISAASALFLMPAMVYVFRRIHRRLRSATPSSRPSISSPSGPSDSRCTVRPPVPVHRRKDTSCPQQHKRR